MGSAQPQPAGGWVALMTSATHLRLVLGGEVDGTVTVELNEAISEAANQRLPVEVDTRQVTFMDSLAMAALARLAAGRDDPLHFIDPPEIVRFLLDVTRIGEVVEINDDDPGFPSTT